MRWLPWTIPLLLAGAEDPLREIVDRVRDIEAQVSFIERHALQAPPRSELWIGALRGIVMAADPEFGQYLTPAEVAVRDLGQEPLRYGLGFAWRRVEGRALVTRVVPDSPAARAGLAVGWQIEAVGEISGSEALRFADALARGPDQVRLRCRDLEGRERTIELSRAELADDGLSASDEPLSGIVHLRIGRFLPAADPLAPLTATASAVRRALQRPGLRAVILDLRGCTGGSLQAAVEIAAGWLPPGSGVIEQVGRNPALQRVWTATVEPLPDVPLVVLIDGDTASAAEVLALALRRQRRAPLIGAPSAGKWTMQQLFLLPDNSGIVLTVARLQPPGGPALSGPLQPDLPVPQEPNATWRAWSGLGRDEQLARAIDVATALAVPSAP
ncbi:MAG: S41 family peptidase [Planctomycetota bacterium]|nr:S41 family peptidase [Planctomycetota bacterium]MDW8373095.1 S41 family peptidase [Planctomycetota bacterium]